MKKSKLIYVVLCISAMLVSCDDFLSTMPDNRAELNTEAKVASILVSAYPNKAPIIMMEYGTDNVMDNGALYASDTRKEEVYQWKDITTDSSDDPRYMWQAHYSAIAAANQALQAIDDLGNPASLAPHRAEALICRAYAHFVLANVFCLPYNPETADKDMGLPYAEKPETQVDVKYERGTMAGLYQKINDDIEAALPGIRDEVYTVPKYHFNKKAAYAFAARFNLLYVKTDKSNYQKVIDYATQVLGSTPENAVRRMSAYLPLGAADISNAYVQVSEVANLLIIPAYSLAGRMISGTGARYNHNMEIVSYETVWASGPWGSSGSGGFLISQLYGTNQSVRFPKLDEFWEATDKTGNTGYAHVVHVPFTADEALLCRAEAYTFQEKYAEAAADLNIWQEAHCKKTVGANTLATLTRDIINNFWNSRTYTPIPLNPDNAGKDRSIKKTLHPQGFTVAEGEQENFIQCVLHYRRIENLHDGQRWVDIKRYGIEVEHNRDGLSSDILKSDDLRRALQLPSDVINAGLPANPR
ncbi:MAG: RagB/SusD family nutrient uptake outer membrane protein [Mediterranea sp.]|nr:RagB/SusD family nutrient uptake outer membrane protein [Mediterranea sp.]